MSHENDPAVYGPAVQIATLDLSFSPESFGDGLSVRVAVWRCPVCRYRYDGRPEGIGWGWPGNIKFDEAARHFFVEHGTEADAARFA